MMEERITENQQTENESDVTQDAHSIPPRYMLDEHIVTVWRMRLILWLILYGVISVILYIIAPFYISLPCNFLFFCDLIYRFFRAAFVYKNSSFAFGDEDIRFRTGFLFIKEILVPFSRIQHLDIHQGPIERYFDLSTLIIHTAGQSGDAIKIPGLQEVYAEHLRTYLKSFIKSEDGDT